MYLSVDEAGEMLWRLGAEGRSSNESKVSGGRCKKQEKIEELAGRSRHNRRVLVFTDSLAGAKAWC